MDLLSLVLKIKIAVTIFIWIVPTLFFPIAWLKKMGFPDPGTDVFLRLLGTAFTALVVGYVFGLKDWNHQIYPDKVVWVGIVSNGLACGVLLLSAAKCSWAEWGKLASGSMWFSLFATGLITAGLIAFGPCR